MVRSTKRAPQLFTVVFIWGQVLTRQTNTHPPLGGLWRPRPVTLTSPHIWMLFAFLRTVHTTKTTLGSFMVESMKTFQLPKWESMKRVKVMATLKNYYKKDNFLQSVTHSRTILVWILASLHRRWESLNRRKLCLPNPISTPP